MGIDLFTEQQLQVQTPSNVMKMSGELKGDAEKFSACIFVVSIPFLPYCSLTADTVIKLLI
jgi:hypothetical protein